MESHHATIGTRDHPPFILRLRDGSGRGFELAVKEFVEGLETVEGVENLVDVEGVECDEWRDVGGGFGRVVLESLFYRERFEQSLCYEVSAMCHGKKAC